MMEASDIGAAISAANAPLIRAVDKVELQLQQVAERLNQLPTVYMARNEYEARHTELFARVTALENKYGDEHRWSLTEHARIVDQFSKDLDELRGDIEASRGHALSIWIAAGGWIFGLIGIVLGHFWK